MHSCKQKTWLFLLCLNFHCFLPDLISSSLILSYISQTLYTGYQGPWHFKMPKGQQHGVLYQISEPGQLWLQRECQWQAVPMWTCQLLSKQTRGKLFMRFSCELLSFHHCYVVFFLNLLKSCINKLMIWDTIMMEIGMIVNDTQLVHSEY